MPNQQINSITSATTTDGSELLPVVSGGVTKAVSVSTINSGIAADAVSDVYEARDLAVGQSSIAAAAALVAGSIAQQDLTAVSAALHRSPNAVTSMFVYDTTKDSDGGAWTEKCQHTSWYNETLSGKWLGAWGAESDARILGAATLGPERIPSGTFETDPAANGWSNTTSTWSGSALRATFTAGGQSVNLGWKLLTNDGLVSGKTYKLQFEVKSSCLVTQQTFIVVNVATNDAYNVSGNRQYDISGNATQTLTYYFVAPSDQSNLKLFITGISQDLGGRIWPQTLTVDNVSIKEVTVVGTVSSDYYQSTADGKFYRLWKNLYSNTKTPYSSAPSNRQVGLTLGSTSITTPDGSISLELVVPTATSNKHAFDYNFGSAGSTGVAYTYSVYAKANGYNYLRIGATGAQYYELSDGYSVVFNLSNGTYTNTTTLGYTASMEQVGTSGIYRCSITSTSGGSTGALFGIAIGNSATWQDYTGDGVSGIYLGAIQREIGSTATAYEPKGIEGSVSEVFRGNKREFPKLSAIVAHSPDSKANIVIYDLTEPGRPMWMVFKDNGSNTSLIMQMANASAIHCTQGRIMLSGTADQSAFTEINIPTDSARRITNSGAWSGNFRGNIGARNTSIGWAWGSPIYLAGPVSYSISSTILSDAPVDPVTGLQVPTIAVATTGGVSVIKHNGTVVSSSQNMSPSDVVITPTMLWATGYINNNLIFYAKNPGTLGASFGMDALNWSAANAAWTDYNVVGNLIESGGTLTRRATAGNMLLRRKANLSTPGNSIASTITNTYNTGHMVGDIRRTYLADTAVGSVYSPALTMQNMITTAQQGVWYDPSDFTTLFQDSSGNTPVTAVEQSVGLILDKSKNRALGPELVTNGNFSNGSTGWVLNAATVTDGKLVVTNAANFAYQTGILTAGKWYYVELDVTYTAGAELRINTSVGIPETGEIRWLVTNGKLSGIFRSSGTLLSIEARTSLFTGTIDNVSVKEVLGNHAFNSSGNSANFPVLSARYNLLTKTEDFSDGVWTKANAVITANAATAPDGTLTADRLVGSGGWYTQQRVTLATGVSYTVSCYVKSNTGVLQTFRLYGSNNITSSDLTATTEWKRFTFSFTATLDDGHGIARNTAGDPNDLLVWGADLRVANDGVNQPAYQRVNTATDYDTVGFKPYLKFNGSSQWMQTNSIDFTATDKMFVCAGVRKLSDAAAGVITELSAAIGANAGSFYIFAGNNSGYGASKYATGSRGTSIASTTTAGTYAAPITNILSGQYSISEDISRLRVNGVQDINDTADQGTGNYGNYPLYIGARAGTSLWFNGRLYQLVIVNKTPTADELKSTETTINRKTLAYAE